VGGAARKLAIDMNAVIIGNGVPETEGAAGVDAWHRLAEIKVRSQSRAAISTCLS
jgi:hypothetical protein